MNARYRYLITVMGVLTVIAAGCTAVNTSSSAPPSTLTTSTSIPAPTSTAPPTTTSTSSTNVTVEAGDAPTLKLSGSDVVYAIDGPITIEGWVDQPCTVTIGNVEAETHSDPGANGRTSFRSDLILDPGRHTVPVVATNERGIPTSRIVTVLIDPTLVRKLAYIEEVHAEAGTIVADLVDWLTGEAARTAAIADGEITEDGDLDEDYYIRNQNPRLRTLAITPDAPIVIYACYPDNGPCLTRESVRLTTFEQLTADPGSSLAMEGWSWYGSGYSPYWLTIQGNNILQVEEQYLP